MNLFSHSVTLRKRGEKIGEDRYGVPEYGPPTDTVSDAWWEPRTSSEDTAAREQYTWGYWVYLPEGTDLDGADLVVIDGVEYEVVGQPGRQPGGFIVDGFVKVAVERTTG